jgi:hypothetical protein
MKSHEIPLNPLQSLGFSTPFVNGLPGFASLATTIKNCRGQTACCGGFCGISYHMKISWEYIMEYTIKNGKTGS